LKAMPAGNAMQDQDEPVGRSASERQTPGSGQAMRIEVRLVREPIHAEDLTTDLRRKGVDGAWAEFTGFVRADEDSRCIEGLEYEAYETMALRIMREILLRLGRQYPCSAAGVIHRLGVIPVGEAAIWVGVASRHRREAFALLTGFMDELKRDVPIWKRRAVFAVPKP